MFNGRGISKQPAFNILDRISTTKKYFNSEMQNRPITSYYEFKITFVKITHFTKPIHAQCSF